MKDQSKRKGYFTSTEVRNEESRVESAQTQPKLMRVGEEQPTRK